jgi:hypothetical protein
MDVLVFIVAVATLGVSAATLGLVFALYASRQD